MYLSDKVRYGDKSDRYITDRTVRACSLLKSQGADTVVLACNTATAVAIERLRMLDDSVRYIGTEPAVKPALNSCDFVTVALTPVAARQKRFARLINGYEKRIRVVAFANIAAEIEQAKFEERKLCRIAEKMLAEVNGEGLVLGCTHYVFLKKYLAKLSPKLKLFDGNEGVARQLPKAQESSVKFLNVEF